MARTYRILRRPWRARRPLYWGMVPELAGIIPLLVLYALQTSNKFRTTFWQIGFEQKLNSNPNMILYAYANHRPLPTVPFVWSTMLTNFNVAISIVSLFLLLAKMIATIMKVFFPLFGAIAGLCMTVLYAVSVYGQAGPDYADSRYPSPSPWYLRMGCSIAEPYKVTKSCQMAQGTFAVTIYLLTVYLFQTALAVWSMLPNKELDMCDSDDDDEYGPSQKTEGAAVEMQPTPPPQAVPFTPRTQAFHALERKLPFRNS